MAIQVYCTADDIAPLAGAECIAACIDRNQDGVISTSEENLITSAIQRGAVKINADIRHQYVLSQVANNDYLNYANIVYALYELRTLGLNPAEPSLDTKYQEVKQELHEVRWGRNQLPDQAPSFECLPTVSSMQVQMCNPDSPVVVNPNQSTGSPPNTTRRRITSWSNFWYW